MGKVGNSTEGPPLAGPPHRAYIQNSTFCIYKAMLNIRDPRAAELARWLAESRGATMTQVVIQALEQEVQREKQASPLSDRLSNLARKAAALAGPKARAMTQDEIDALSGQ